MAVVQRHLENYFTSPSAAAFQVKGLALYIAVMVYITMDCKLTFDDQKKRIYEFKGTCKIKNDQNSNLNTINGTKKQ